MSEKTDTKPEALPDLDDLLQCPVCYEIPSGQIFQCNEGHHVCGRCKARLDVCPVCRALFFGTRNYAMEELIANVRKLRAFKLGGKVTTGTDSINNSSAKESTSDESESNAFEDEESDDPQVSSRSSLRAPQACKGLFRCLCCKNGNAERLPAARLLNHLRYFHSSYLIEGRSENGEYVQAWQFSTVPGKLVTAVRVSDMGVFFLTIEINTETICAWLTMAASPWVSHDFSYTVTISGNDREAIFSDCVWSVRACEGSLKKRGHCLIVDGGDARALTAPTTISGKLCVRRTPPDQQTQPSHPRAVLRVANRVSVHDLNSHTAHTANNAHITHNNHDNHNNRNNHNNHNAHPAHSHDLEPFLQDLQNDVARLSRAFATLGREANALVRSEAEIRARIENTQNIDNESPTRSLSPTVESNQPQQQQSSQDDQQNGAQRQYLSRSARRRMRMRMRAALNAPESAPVEIRMPLNQQGNNRPVPMPRQNGPTPNNRLLITQHPSEVEARPAPRARGAVQPQPVAQPPVVQPPTASPPNTQPVGGPSNLNPQNVNVRTNKKKRRNRK